MLAYQMETLGMTTPALALVLKIYICFQMAVIGAGLPDETINLNGRMKQ
jgi:hypothetical protein